MIFFQQQTAKIGHEKCPVCDAMHQILKPFGEVEVIKCPLIPDLIYLRIIATKETREIIRNSLLGT